MHSARNFLTYHRVLKNCGNIENKHKSWQRYGEEKVEMDVSVKMRYESVYVYMHNAVCGCVSNQTRLDGFEAFQRELIWWQEIKDVWRSEFEKFISFFWFGEL